MTDCIIVGGGLLGMLSARMLHQEGAEVMLLERGALGQESSWAGGGILSPLYPWRYPAAVTALASLSQQWYPGLAGELAEETGIDPEWTLSGMLVLDPEEEGPARAWAAEHDYTVEVVEGSALHACEPALGVQHRWSLWLPQVAQIRNPRLIKALRASLEGRAIAFQEDTPVIGVRVRHGRVTGVVTTGGELSAPRVVIAGGAWSAGLLPSASGSLPVEPVRGQMLLFRVRPGQVRRMIMRNGRYLIPRRDGHILAGSTVERVGFDKEPTDDARQELAATACDMVPGLEYAPLQRHWAGLRPGSPTGVPYIAEHPEVAGLFVNAGHFRNGVVLGLASARLLADLITGRPPKLDPRPYALTNGIAERPNWS